VFLPFSHSDIATVLELPSGVATDIGDVLADHVDGLSRGGPSPERDRVDAHLTAGEPAVERDALARRIPGVGVARRERGAVGLGHHDDPLSDGGVACLPFHRTGEAARLKLHDMPALTLSSALTV
jgi:hypothetical protein